MSDIGDVKARLTDINDRQQAEMARLCGAINQAVTVILVLLMVAASFARIGKPEMDRQARVNQEQIAWR